MVRLINRIINDLIIPAIEVNILPKKELGNVLLEPIPIIITVINQKGKKIGYVPKAANKLMLYELKTESLYGIIFKADTEPDIRISAEVWASVRE